MAGLAVPTQPPGLVSSCLAGTVRGEFKSRLNAFWEVFELWTHRPTYCATISPCRPFWRVLRGDLLVGSRAIAAVNPKNASIRTNRLRLPLTGGMPPLPKYPGRKLLGVASAPALVLTRREIAHGLTP